MFDIRKKDDEYVKGGAIHNAFVDIYEGKDRVVVVADMPGVTDKTVDVTVEKETLSIVGHVEAEGEREAREYRRSFSLTDRIGREGITAAVKHGVLTLTLPLAEEAKAKKIPVTIN